MAGEETRERLGAVLDSLDDIPSLPIIVTQLIKTINDPTSSAIDIARIINNDQAVTAKILKLVNSAYFGFHKKITTVQHAISILGFDAVRSIALSLSVFDLVEGDLGLFNKENFWGHSIGCAVCSREIAKLLNIDEETTGTSFVSGLLHDVGKLILFKYFNQDFNKAIRIAAIKQAPLFKAEMMVMGVSHAAVGFRLSRKWEFPDEICFAIRHHHEWNETVAGLEPGQRKIIAIVHLANLICIARNFGYSGYETTPELIREYYEELGITRPQIQTATERAEKEYLKSLELLKLI